jgi:hypothetical protein
MAVAEGRYRLSQLRHEMQQEERLFGPGRLLYPTGASLTDYAALRTANTSGEAASVLQSPGNHGLPADSMFVGCYRPAPSAGVSRAFFYRVGVNVVLMYVFGQFPSDPNTMQRAQALLAQANELNFVPAPSGLRTDRAFVHSPVKGHADVTRDEAVHLGLCMALYPLEFAEHLIERGYEYVETGEAPSKWPSTKAPGVAKRKLSSGAMRPALGFVLQLPPSAGSGKPVCVLAPARNESPAT